MESFAEWLGTPPPVVQKQENVIPILAGIKAAIPQVKQFLLRALQVSLLERASDVAWHAETYILPSPTFREWLGRWGKLIKNGSTYSKSCGKDGCAYFCTGEIVCKISDDGREMSIAEKIKGKLDIVPVIDAVEIETEESDELAYAIVMKKLSTDILPQHVRYAAEILADVCDVLMDKIKKKPDYPVENIRKRLSLTYFTRDMAIDEATGMCLKDMIRQVKYVYVKSGYLLGADWSARNIGLAGDKPQAFDFGRAYSHQPAKTPSTQRHKLFIQMGK